MPTPLTDADKVIRNDTGISIANALTALAGVVRGGNENIGDAYNSNNSYAAGDYCIYENTLYKCTGATSGAWDSTKWTAVTVSDELALMKDLVIIDYVNLFNGVSIPNNTEYNSNGSTIPHVTIPTKAGYKAVAVVNTRSLGYYGSRIVLYAWIDSTDNKIHYSAYNPMENFQYTPSAIGYAWVLYIRN